jgi:hypothetical protein
MEGDDEQARIENERRQVNAAWNDFWSGLGSAFSSGADFADDVAIDMYSAENTFFAVAGVSTGALLAKMYRKLRRGKSVPLGSVEFDDATAAASNRLGFDADDVAIKNGVAELPIIFSTTLSRDDGVAVERALQSQGATSFLVNTGPIINSRITRILEHRLGKNDTYMGSLLSR